MLVVVLIITHIASFIAGALIFRNNSKKANEVIDVIKK